MKKPTLEKVQKDLENFPHEIIMYCYHKLNNRDEEAQGYLDAYLEEQNAIKTELMYKVEEIKEPYEKIIELENDIEI